MAFMVAFDFLIFVLIAARSWRLSKEQRILERANRKSLAQVILEGGSIYFLYVLYTYSEPFKMLSYSFAPAGP